MLLDERPLCKLPCREALDPGSYRVTVRSGAAQSTAPATLERGRTLELRLEVTPSPSPSTSPLAALQGPPPPTTGRAGWLTWVGAGVALAGAAGVVGFGLRDQSLHDRYLEQPTVGTRDAGLTMRALTNVSLGVAVAGAVAIAVDLALVRTGRVSRASRTSWIRPAGRSPVVGSFAF